MAQLEHIEAFQRILTEDLSVRAKGVLGNLGVKDVAALLRLTRDDLLQAWGCGEKTIAEVEALRLKLLPREDKEATRLSGNDMDFDSAPKEVFNAVQDSLSVRGLHVLENLGVDSLKSFMMLNREQLMECRNCGRKTADEIMRILADLSAFTSGLIHGTSDFRPELLLNAPCLTSKTTTQTKIRPQKDGQPTPFSADNLGLEDVSRQTFNAVQDSLSVRATHTLEELGIDNLKAFMMLNRKQLFKRRGCGRKTANEILQVQDGIARELAHKTSEFRPEPLLAAPCLTGITNGQTNKADVENPAPWLAKWVRGLARSERETQAFMLRKGMLGLAPMTLDHVGEKVGRVSRERVRQLEKAVEKKAATSHQQHRLRPLIDAVADVVKQRGGMVGLDELTKAVLCRGKDGDQLTYATELISFFSTLQVWKDAGLLLQDGVVRNEDSRPLIHRLADVVEEVALAAADERHSGDLWSIDREHLKDALRKSTAMVPVTTPLGNISDTLLDAVIKQCRGRVKAHKDRVYSVDLWRLRCGTVVQMLDTVLHQIGKPAHFSEITEHASKWRHSISERNVHATLDRSKNALLWDRGTFVHKDKVVIPLSLIHDVENWLLKVLQEDVPFVSVNGAFLHFPTRCKQAACPSEVALYTCLRQSAHPELAYPRLPCVYLKKGFTERIPIPVAFEDFLRDAGGPVSQQEVREFGIEKIFLKDYQFNQSSQRVSNVIRTADWGYIHIDKIELDKESILPLITYTQEVLTKEEHCSVDKIYLDKRVTCRSSGIDGPVMLYSVLQCFAEELFSLDGYPRVARSHASQKRSRHSIRRRVLDFVRDSGKPCPYEVLEKRFVEQLGYKEQQVYFVNLDAEVCLYHTGCVIHLQSLAWDEVKQHALERAALHTYEDAVRAGLCFGRVSRLVESPALPPLPSDLHWSRTMIADMLAKGGRYLVLGNSREAFLPRENNQNIHSFEALVGKLLNRDWGGAANLAEFEGALLKTGIIKKRLTPAMLGTGQTVVINNGEIILKELLVDAQRP